MELTFEIRTVGSGKYVVKCVPDNPLVSSLTVTDVHGTASDAYQAFARALRALSPPEDPS